jgi:filamentous hemagglutinin family protein
MCRGVLADAGPPIPPRGDQTSPWLVLSAGVQEDARLGRDAGTGTMARRRDGRLLLGLVLSMTLLWPAPGRTEVATDGTLGAKVRLTGKDVRIPARLGQIRGKNLFHSFERFGVPTRGRVTFTGPDGLKNVIGRVTGGEPSSIDGTLASKVRGADLWLLNPAGILFGPHARLDVPGSFHASTADELRFIDGRVFSALDPDGSVLSVAAPEAFGFLGAKPAGIDIDRSVLKVRKGEALSITAGDITIRGSDDNNLVRDGLGGEPGTVRARAGWITLDALGGPGAVTIGTGKATGAITGTIRLIGKATVVASGDGGGTIRIRGGRLLVEDTSFVLADNLGASPPAGGIAIAADDIEIRSDSKISSSTFGPGNAGEVVMTANTIELGDGGLIRSSTQGSGKAGEMTVTAGHLQVDDAGSGMFTGVDSRAGEGPTGNAGRVAVTADTIEIRGGGLSSSTFGAGNAGEVTVRAGHLRVDGSDSKIRIGIVSRAEDRATGAAGRVAIEAGAIELRGGSDVSSSTFGPGKAGEVVVAANTIELSDRSLIRSSSRGQGNAGDVTVTAAGRLRVDGAGAQSSAGIDDAGLEIFTGIDSRAGFNSSGAAGDVVVTADTIELRNGGRIRSFTRSAHDAGEVMVTAAGHLLVDGAGVEEFTLVESRASEGSTGDAGRVAIKADIVDIRDGGLIRSSTRGRGDAGEIKVTAGHLRIDDAGAEVFTGITSRAAKGSTGDAGRVAIKADTIEIRGGALGNSTYGEGNAGEVTVTTTGYLRIDGTGSKIVTGILSDANSGFEANAGRVAVTAGTIEIRGGDISSSTFGPGKAGELLVTAIGRLTIADEGGVETNSEASGTAGDVVVRAAHLTVRDGGEISSSGTGSGPAGGVRVDAGTLKVVDARIGTDGTGAEGGRIAVTASDLISLENAEVTSNGIVPDLGASVITLRAPLIALNGSRVTSLTNGQPLGGSGLAQLFGDVTVISADSFVAASSNVTLTGVEGDIGSRLVVPEGAFLNVGDLLRESCAARRSGAASSFTAMGRGGALSDPAGPLAGAYREPDDATVAGQAGPVLAASPGEGRKPSSGG